MMKVTVLFDYEDIWGGTTMEVESECVEYYYGILSERGDSFNGKLRKEFCVEVPDNMSFIERYVWFDDQKKMRDRDLKLKVLLENED